MQYFLDKLKEFLVFLVFSRLVQGVVGTLIGHCVPPTVERDRRAWRKATPSNWPHRLEHTKTV